MSRTVLRNRVGVEPGQVVILDQDGIVQAHAMIFPPAAAHGIFVKLTPAGNGLAGVVDSRSRAGHRIHIGPRGGGNAAEPLQKIEQRSFDGENQPRRSVDLSNHRAGRQDSAVFNSGVDRQVGRVGLLDDIEHRDTGKHARFTCHQLSGDGLLGQGGHHGGNVILGTIFLDGHLPQPAQSSTIDDLMHTSTSLFPCSILACVLTIEQPESCDRCRARSVKRSDAGVRSAAKSCS